MSFASRLWKSLESKNTPAMVGLDPRPENFPEPFRTNAAACPSAAAKATVEYHRELLPLLAKKIPVVKPQAAFFEQMGEQGFAALADAIGLAKDLGLLVLMDAKRGDIGSTSTAYAKTFLGGGLHNAFPASDALTVNPYLGEDACQPFLETAAEHGAGLFFLVKTSNPGATLFQNHGSPPLADIVADSVRRWGESFLDESGWSSLGAVVGATRPEELQHFRDRLPKAPLLLPGFGHQGGTAKGLDPAFDEFGRGAVVNSSRGVLWAHQREEFAHLGSWEEKVLAAVDEMVAALPTVGGSVAQA